MRFIREVREMAHQIGMILLQLFSLSIFLGLGVLCTFYPHVVQRTDQIGPINLRSPFEYFRRRKASPQFIYDVRMTGIVALFCAAGIIYGLVGSFINLLKR